MVTGTAATTERRQLGCRVGLFRVKVGREWMRTDAEKYLFMTPPAALELAVRSAGLGLPEQAAFILAQV